MPKNSVGWSPDLLLEHIMAIFESNDKRYSERFTAQERAVQSALESQEKAINAAKAASEQALAIADTNAQKWRDNANEWRAAMTDREVSFATADQYKTLKERLDLLSGASAATKEQKADIRSTIAAIAAVVIALISLVVVFIKD